MRKLFLLLPLFHVATACHGHIWFEPFPPGKKLTAEVKSLTVFLDREGSVLTDRILLGPPLTNAYDVTLEGTDSVGARLFIRPGSGDLYLELGKQYNAIRIGTVEPAAKEFAIVTLDWGTRAELILEGAEGFEHHNGVHRFQTYFVAARLKIRSPISFGDMPSPSALEATIGNEFRFTMGPRVPSPEGSKRLRWQQMSYPTDER